MKYFDLHGAVVHVGQSTDGETQFSCPSCGRNAWLNKRHRITEQDGGWLNVEPSIVCSWCQWHGFITDGKARTA